MFIRHGQTDWNFQGRYQGTTNTALNEKGRKQAALIGERIANESADTRPTTIVSSPQHRARHTADIVARHLNLPVVENGVWRELSLGRWEGLTSAEVKDRFYQERKGRKSDRWNFVAVGGESMAQRSALIEDAIAKLAENTLIVSHSNIIRIVLHLFGGYDQERAAQAKIPHLALWKTNFLQAGNVLCEEKIEV